MKRESSFTKIEYFYYIIRIGEKIYFKIHRREFYQDGYNKIATTKTVTFNKMDCFRTESKWKAKRLAKKNGGQALKALVSYSPMVEKESIEGKYVVKIGSLYITDMLTHDYLMDEIGRIDSDNIKKAYIFNNSDDAIYYAEKIGGEIYQRNITYEEI